MTSGLHGALIALLWGVYDFLVRYVSREVGPVYALACVLIGGAALPGVFLGLRGKASPGTGEGWMLAALTGAALALASLWLYRAFAIGPVYLVAPVICAYPVLSVSRSFLRGAEARLLDLVAIGGVVLVAATGTDEESRGPDEAAPDAAGRLEALG